MISGNKRIAYYRIPAHDLLYSVDKDACGKFCGKIIELSLKVTDSFLFCSFFLSKWFEPRGVSSLSSVIVRVSVVLKRTVSDND